MTKIQGLNTNEAQKRLKQYGYNEAVKRSHDSPLKVYISKFKSPLVILLAFAAALAVGMTPELLPLIVTLNLTRGSLRMAEKSVIVKHQSAIHNFGSMDILCTDKTGTLTENKITVAKTIDYNHTESTKVLELAAVACQFTTSYASPLIPPLRRLTGTK